MQRISHSISAFVVAVLLVFSILTGNQVCEKHSFAKFSGSEYSLVSGGNTMPSLLERYNHSGPVYLIRYSLQCWSSLLFTDSFKYLTGVFYLVSSGFIILNLDNPDIVFPFHSFW